MTSIRVKTETEETDGGPMQRRFREGEGEGEVESCWFWSGFVGVERVGRSEYI